MTLPFDPAILGGITLLALVLAAAPLWSGLIDATTARVRGYRGASIRRPYGELIALLGRRTDGAAPGWLPTLTLAATAVMTLQLPAILAPPAAAQAAVTAVTTAVVTTAFIVPFVALSLLTRVLFALTAMRGAPARRGTTLARELLLIVTIEPTLLLTLLAAAAAPAAPMGGIKQPMTDAALALSALAFALAAWTAGSPRPLWEPTVALSPANPSAGLLDATAGHRRFPLELALHLRRLTLWIVWVVVFVPTGGGPWPLAAGVLLVKLVAVALILALVEGRLVQRGLLRAREIPAVALALAIAGLALLMFGRSPS